MPKGTCSIEGCPNPHDARGWCAVHYMRWRRTGDPLTPLTTRARRPAEVPFEDWFSDQFTPGPNGCLDWKRGTDANGYGTVGRDGMDLKVHRVAWELANGPIPDGLHILHRCDRPICGNVDHLFPGTQAENVADMIAKGRQVSGTAARGAKLTEADVWAVVMMRAHGLTQARIAGAVGTDQGSVSCILSGKKWKAVAPILWDVKQ